MPGSGDRQVQLLMPRSRLGRLSVGLGVAVVVCGLVAAQMTELMDVQHAGVLVYIGGIAACLATLVVATTFERLALVRLIQDLPTSRVRSAPQGYVELHGKVQSPPTALICPRCGVRCVWFRALVQRRAGKWTLETSDDPASMVIQDSTGACTVNLSGATVLFAHPAEHLHGHIIPGQWVRVLGEFRTHHFSAPAPGSITRAMRVDELHRRLKDLRADPRRMAIFDVNRDGSVDFREWEAARRVTEAQLDREIAAAPEIQQASDCIGEPRSGADRQPFVICAGSEAQITRASRFVMLGSAGLALFYGTFLALFVMLVNSNFEQARQREARRVERAARAAAPRPDSDFRKLARQEDTLEANARWPEIIALWDGYVASHREDGKGWAKRGRARYYAGDLPGAVTDSQHACELGVKASCEWAARNAARLANPGTEKP